MSGGRLDRLVGLLRLCRGVTDEIVVALDDRYEGELGLLPELADTVIRFPYADPVERTLGWLHGRCRGEWLLRVDDDEAPSRILLDALPELVTSRDVTHYWLPRRWLFPDAGSFLAEAPWVPDYQLRLGRREHLRFPGIIHVPVEASGPSRYLETPLYHLDLLVSTHDARRRKAQRYERARPGQRVAGRALNEAYYLPEARRPETAPVPLDDALLVRAVLEGEPTGGGRGVGALPRATREDVDAAWAQRPWTEGAYRARIEPLFGRPTLVAGEVSQLDVAVVNLGTERWPWGPRGQPEIRVSYRWKGLEHGALRTPLPHDLAPGRRCRVPVSVEAPPEPGRRTLELDLVHEHVRWFGCAAAVELEVRPRKVLAFLADQPPAVWPEADARLEEALLLAAELAPEHEPVVLGPRPAELADRFGYRAEQGPRERLLRGIEPGRARVRGLLRLLGRARTLARDRGDPFVTTLARADAVVVLPLPAGADTRDLAVQAAVAEIARSLAIPVLPLGRRAPRSGIDSVLSRRVRADETPAGLRAFSDSVQGADVAPGLAEAGAGRRVEEEGVEHEADQRRSDGAEREPRNPE